MKNGTKSLVGIGAAVAVLGFVAAVSSEQPASVSSSVSEPQYPSRQHEQALEAAQGYIELTHFSETGLTKQLTTSDQYPPDVATWAVANSGADWNVEALESAQGYLDLTHFSDAELRDQLVSSDEYTPGQADYAMSRLGG